MLSSGRTTSIQLSASTAHDSHTTTCRFIASPPPASSRLSSWRRTTPPLAVLKVSLNLICRSYLRFDPFYVEKNLRFVERRRVRVIRHPTYPIIVRSSDLSPSWSGSQYTRINLEDPRSKCCSSLESLLVKRSPSKEKFGVTPRGSRRQGGMRVENFACA